MASSKLASSTLAYTTLAYIRALTGLGRDAPQIRQYAADFERGRTPLAEAEIKLAIDGIHLLIYGCFRRLRFHSDVAGTQRALRFLDALERSRGEEGEDGRPETGDVAPGHQDRLAHHIGVDLIEHRVLLRDAAAV